MQFIDYYTESAEKAMAPHSSTLAWKIPWTEEPGRLQSMGSLRLGHDFTFIFTFHFHALEKEMETHSSVLDWRIPGTTGPGGLTSVGSHRVRHDWSNLAAAAAYWKWKTKWLHEYRMFVCVLVAFPHDHTGSCDFFCCPASWESTVPYLTSESKDYNSKVWFLRHIAFLPS